MQQRKSTPFRSKRMGEPSKPHVHAEPDRTHKMPSSLLRAALAAAFCALASASDAPCGGAWAGAAWCAPVGPPFAPRAAALVANLTASEKAQLILMIDGGVPRLSIAPYIWWSEALHGAIAPFQHHSKKPATCWPEPIGVGSSFNTSLFSALGELTSTEGRGLQAGMGHTYWAPNVNIMRDPRWGRGQETPGEGTHRSNTDAAGAAVQQPVLLVLLVLVYCCCCCRRCSRC